MAEDYSIAGWIVSGFAIIFILTYASISIYYTCYDAQKNKKYIETLEKKYQSMKDEFIIKIKEITELEKKLDAQKDSIKKITQV